MQAKASEEQTSQRKSPKETDEELRQIALYRLKKELETKGSFLKKFKKLKFKEEVQGFK